jgi:hypothetical protein
MICHFPDLEVCFRHFQHQVEAILVLERLYQRSDVLKVCLIWQKLTGTYQTLSKPPEAGDDNSNVDKAEIGDDGNNVDVDLLIRF